MCIFFLLACQLISIFTIFYDTILQFLDSDFPSYTAQFILLFETVQMSQLYAIFKMQLYLIFSFSVIALICNICALPRDLSTLPYQVNQPLRNIQPIDVNLRDKNAKILSYSNEFNPEDHSFVFQFETDNGIKAEGWAKDDIVSVRGSYFIQLQDGSQVPVQYVADENGFQVDSAAIPTPHPSIAKLVQYLRTLPSERGEGEEDKSGGIDV